MRKPEDLTDIIESKIKIEKSLSKLKSIMSVENKLKKKMEHYYAYQDEEYDVDIVECANNRLLVCIYNSETDEDIRIDEKYKDVKKLYQVLKEYFEK